jgi:hypothetical protein
MIWITITADDLNDYQAGKLINAARTKALAAGQTDPFPKVAADIVANVRAQVRRRRSNRVSLTPNSIPPDLRKQTILLIIETMQSRLPGVSLDDDIKTLIKDAKDYVNRVGAAEINNPIPIAIPDDPEPIDDVQRGGMIETVQDGNSGNSREELSRL